MSGLSPLRSFFYKAAALTGAPGRTFALALAADRGDIETVTDLLSSRVNPHARHDEALELAAWNGHTEIVNVLLGGADLAAKNGALSMAVLGDHTETVRALLDGGATARKNERIGGVCWALCAAAENGYEEVLQVVTGWRSREAQKASAPGVRPG